LVKVCSVLGDERGKGVEEGKGEFGKKIEK
jgi:hypothetical protein